MGVGVVVLLLLPVFLGPAVFWVARARRTAAGCAATGAWASHLLEMSRGALLLVPYGVVKELDMRYVLMVLGAIGLAMGFLMFANAHHPDHISQATVALQLGGIFLAVGMATVDIIEAIKGKRSRP